jgi:hypothetical protein
MSVALATELGVPAEHERFDPDGLRRPTRQIRRIAFGVTPTVFARRRVLQ